jgi:hypothetical protein
MKPTIFLLISLFFGGCVSPQVWWQEVLVDEAVVDEQLVNYALPENDAIIYVSEDNPNHPSSTLNNGIISSENWNSGEGWEARYDGRFGIRRNALTFEGEEVVSTPMGWVVIEFPQEHLIGKVFIYTIDSPEYPAQKYGINSVQLQYWIQYKYAGMEVKGWRNVSRYDKRVGQQFDSIRRNTEGKIVFRFKPVSTSKIRLLVLWTNDAQKYKLGTEEYRRGAVRLIEVEVFGYEKKGDGGTMARSSAPSEEDELSKALSIKPTQLDENPTVELTVKAYEQAYRDRNLTDLMATISPNYSRDGETYQQLEAQMRSLFENYSKIEFQLQGLKVFQKAPNATAEANYSVKLEGSGVKQLSLSGKLFFTLSKGDDAWKITRIDTQK